MSKSKHTHTRLVRCPVTLEDGSVDVELRPVLVLPDGTEVDPATLDKARARFRTLTPKRRVRPPRKGTPANVVGQVTLAPKGNQ